MQDKIQPPSSPGEIEEAQVMTAQASTSPFTFDESSKIILNVWLNILKDKEEFNIENEDVQKLFEATLVSKNLDLALSILKDLFKKADSPGKRNLVLKKLRIKENLLGLIEANDFKSFVELFIFFQENISQENKADFTRILNSLLTESCKRGLNDFAKLILRQRYFEVDVNYEGLLDYACKRCDIDVVRLISERVDYIDEKDNYRKTPLHFACQSGKLEIVKYLIEQRGADVNDASNIGGITPLHSACESGNLNLVIYLVERGAVIDAKHEYRGVPLHFGCESGNLDLVKYLVERGAEINSKNKFGITPLHIACERGSFDLVKFLLESGSDFNTKDSYYGKTPLHFACEAGKLETVKFWLDQRGVDINEKDKYGRTPLHLACENKHLRDNLETIKYLLKHGASVNEKDTFRRTPFDYLTYDDSRRSIIEFYENLQSAGNDLIGERPVNSREESISQPAHFFARRQECNLEMASLFAPRQEEPISQPAPALIFPTTLTSNQSRLGNQQLNLSQLPLENQQPLASLVFVEPITNQSRGRSLNSTQINGLPTTSNNSGQSLLRVGGSSLQTTQQRDLPEDQQVSEASSPESPESPRACAIYCTPVSCVIS